MVQASNYIDPRFEASDIESFYSTVRASINDLPYWMLWCSRHNAFSDAENWIKKYIYQWVSNAEYPPAMLDVATCALIGGTGVSQINRAYKIGNIGYWVSTRYKGQCVAQYAAH